MSAEKKYLKLEDVPMEVQKVWALEWMWENHGIAVGSTMYQECQRIAEKYPEYFPIKQLPETNQSK